MVVMLVPTRNRPTSLGLVLDYLGKFYPKTSLIIADGSADEYHSAYDAMLAEAPESLTIDYKRYAFDMPFLDRVRDVLLGLDHECVAMGADDDFPNMDMFNQGEVFLRDHPDYVSAMADTVNLALLEGGEMWARLNLVRPLEQESAQARIASYVPWHFSTTYATTRREHMLDRYKRLQGLFVPGFYDFSLGLHDCVAGKIKIFPEIGYFCTRNDNHSYVRLEAKSTVLHQSSNILKLMELTKSDLTATGVDPTTAGRIAKWAYEQRVVEHCDKDGDRWRRRARSGVMSDPQVDRQIEQFRSVFTPNTKVRSTYEDRLRFAVDAMRANSVSNDNALEPKEYADVGDMQGHRTD